MHEQFEGYAELVKYIDLPPLRCISGDITGIPLSSSPWSSSKPFSYNCRVPIAFLAADAVRELMHEGGVIGPCH